MKYIKTIFSLSVALAMVAMTPSFAFAQEVVVGGSTAGTVSSPATVTGGSTAGVSSPATVTGGSTSGTIPSPVIVTGGSTAGTVFSPATVTGGSTAGVSSPATVTGGSTAGIVSSPGTVTGGSTAGTISSPATVTGGSTAGTVSSPATVTGGSTAGTATTPTTPPANNPGTSGNTAFGGGGGSSSGSYLGTSTLPLLANIGDCNYLASYLKIGQNNPVIEVTKLQNFLKTNEGMNIAVTGIFDQTTFDAVSAFQVKYTADVLTPWGITGPTGYVYYTTSKKINELYCKKNFALTPAQIAEIEAYRTGVINGSHSAVTGDVGIDHTSTTTPGSTIAKNSTTTDNSQVGAVAKTSLAARIWNFIKRIFGR